MNHNRSAKKLFNLIPQVGLIPPGLPHLLKNAFYRIHRPLAVGAFIKKL